MIEPKEITIETQRGESRVYVLSKFPAIQGREIIAKYPLSAVPKLGDYQVNEETMLKLMSFVAVPRDNGEPLRLTTRALVDNHVPDSVFGLRVEWAMVAYNFDFFGKGGFSGFLLDWLKEHLPLITRTLTQLLPASLQQEFADLLT